MGGVCHACSKGEDARLPQWHSLSKDQQAKYYELARKERLLHSKLYPNWSARDNYVSLPCTSVRTHAHTHTPRQDVT